MSSSKAENNTSDSLNVELKECLSFIYVSTRLTAEIKALEVKVESLTSIRYTLNEDQERSSPLHAMDDSIADLKNDIEKLKNELKANEDEVQKRFKAMVAKLTETCVSKTNESRDHSNQTLLKFSTELKDSVAKEHARLNREIEELKGQVDAAKKKETEIMQELADTKKSLLQQQEQRFNTVKEGHSANLKKLSDKVDSYIALVDKDKLAKNVVDKVQVFVKNYQQEQQQQQQQHQQQQSNQQRQQTETTIPKNIRDFIEKEINVQLEQLKPPANVTIAQEKLDSLEKTTNELTKIVEEQKNKIEKAHSALKNYQPSKATGSDQMAIDNMAVKKHMEEVERHITVMYHNIKIVENFINFKINNIAGLSTSSSRKRMRVDDEDVDAMDEEDISTRLAALEERHQQMIDFVVQFRDNVLDPAFPSRMESTLSRIEQILLNHETFISFFIDPFSTQQNLQRSLPAINNNNVNGTDSSNTNTILDPAVIQAITDLVRKTNDEVANPLENKIKELEQKLEAKRAANQ